MKADIDVEQTYRRELPRLVHYATVLVGPSDAMDVVNEAVTSTLARGGTSQADDLTGYWFGAVTRTAAMWHRSSGRRRARDTRWFSRQSSAADETSAAEDARRVLGGLTHQQQAVVYMTYWLDWSPTTVAQHLAVSEGTVRKQLARARAQLREVLS